MPRGEPPPGILVHSFPPSQLTQLLPVNGPYLVSKDPPVTQGVPPSFHLEAQVAELPPPSVAQAWELEEEGFRTYPLHWVSGGERQKTKCGECSLELSLTLGLPWARGLPAQLPLRGPEHRLLLFQTGWAGCCRGHQGQGPLP